MRTNKIKTYPKNRSYNCRFCGNKVDVVMAISPSGKKKIKRLCCGL